MRHEDFVYEVLLEANFTGSYRTVKSWWKKGGTILDKAGDTAQRVENKALGAKSNISGAVKSAGSAIGGGQGLIAGAGGAAGRGVVFGAKKMTSYGDKGNIVRAAGRQIKRFGGIMQRNPRATAGVGLGLAGLGATGVYNKYKERQENNSIRNRMKARLGL